MSPSRRRKTSARSSKSSRRALADDLELEPAEGAEELPLLEPAEDELVELDSESGIAITCEPTGEEGLDVAMVVDLPEMEKKAVVGALGEPLRRAADQHARMLRHRRIVVRFEGNTLIGSDAKAAVAEIMAAARPAKVVVRRGYGDEVVHESTPPSVTLRSREEAGAVVVDVDSGGLEPEDLVVALEAQMPGLTAGAAGKSFVFAFRGATPDAEGRGWLRSSLVAAGAARARLGEDVLLDRELEARVQLASSEGSAAIQVTPADEEDATLLAMDLVLAPAAAQLRGRKVFVEFLGRAPRARELERLVVLSRQAQPARVQVAAPAGVADQIWPPLLEVEEGAGGVVVRVRDGGRDRAAIIASFAREAAMHKSRLTGRPVTVDWPAGFALDEALEKTCLEATLGACRPTSVACTFGGENREPFLPRPVAVSSAKEAATLRVDTDTGKPAELMRALDRSLGRTAAELAGKSVRVEIHGAGTTSRGMLRKIEEAGRRAGVRRLEIEEGGVVDVVLPPLLHVDKDGGAVRVEVTPSDRTPAQVDLALQRELEAAEIAQGASWTLQASGQDDALVRAALARGASRVVLEGASPLQVHPPLLGAERTGDALVLRAAPSGDEASVTAQIEHELPRLLTAQGDLSPVAVTVVWPGAKDASAGPLAALVERLVAASPRVVLLDQGRGRARQLHPEVVPDYVTLLGRKDDPAAPLAMLGIDQGRGDAHLERVQAKLAMFAPLLEGRRVLLVLRDDGRDRPFAGDDPLLTAVRAFVDSRSAATLVFRGVDANRRPYFEAVHSTTEQVKVGTRFADPRPRPSR